jgi:nitrate/nitrite transporter NarK
VNAGLGNLGVSVVQFLSPLVMTAGIFGIFGGDAQTIVKNGEHAGLDAERRLHLGAVDRHRVARRLVRHARHRRRQGLASPRRPPSSGASTTG